MAQKLDESEIVSFKELLMANSMQVDGPFIKVPPASILKVPSSIHGEPDLR